MSCFHRVGDPIYGSRSYDRMYADWQRALLGLRINLDMIERLEREGIAFVFNPSWEAGICMERIQAHWTELHRVSAIMAAAVAAEEGVYA